MNHIPANWYDDPAGSGQLRYWDGTAWTTHLRDAIPVAPPQLAPLNFPPPVQQQSPPVQQSLYTPRVDPYAQPWQSDPAAGGGFGLSPQQLNTVAALGGSLGGNSRVASIPSALAFLLIGLLGLSFSGLLFDKFSSASEPAPGSVAATGTVVELELEGGACSPIVEFVADGQTYRVYSSVSQQPCPFNLGEAAELTYLPSSPESSARLKSDADSLGIIRIVAYAMFGIAALVGAVSLVRAIQRLRQGQQVWN